MSKYDLRPLGCWDEFELLCFRLWKSIWGDPAAHRYGRQGQRQNGVDIYGHDPFDKSIIGIQCKGKNGNYGSYLTEKEIDAECANALNFRPELGTFIMATTSPRDTKLQDHCNLLNEQNIYHFKVDTWSWDDITDEVICRPDLMSEFYSSYETYSINKILFSRFISLNRLEAFFSRPGLIRIKSSEAIVRLYHLVYELAMNAFDHGMATQFLIQIDGYKITFKDDGLSFNPCSLLLNEYPNGGSTTLRYAKDYFCYNYLYNDDTRENIFEVTYLGDSEISEQHETCELSLKIDDILTREQLTRYVSEEVVKQSAGSRNIVVDIIRDRFAPSLAFSVIDGLADSLKDFQSATVYLPHDFYYEKELKQRADTAKINFIIKDGKTGGDNHIN